MGRKECLTQAKIEETIFALKSAFVEITAMSRVRVITKLIKRRG